jgi:hypothetical protein
VIAALAVAGCGGGDDTSEATLKGDAIPLSEFVTRADRICRDGQDQAATVLGPLQRRFGQDGSVTADEAMVINRKGAELVRPMVKKASRPTGRATRTPSTTRSSATGHERRTASRRPRPSA